MLMPPETTREIPSEVHESQPEDIHVKRSSKRTDAKCNHPETASYELFSAGLPVELWFLIVKHALEPRFATLHEFLPQDIHFFHVSLLVHAFSCPDRTEFKRTRGSIRLVCRFLHSIVNEISSVERQNPSWIWSFSADNAHRYGPCARLDTRFREFSEISAVKEQYQHEVGTVSIHIQYSGLSETTYSLSPLLSNPWALKVLHLTVPGSSDLSQELPLSLLSGLSSLQTLSIAAPKPLRLSGKLGLPELTTLFLTCKLAPESLLSNWSFPKLRKLAIDARGWPYRHEDDHLAISFTDLIQRHGPNISALQLIPIPKPPFTPFSRGNPLAKLEVLATDFVRYPPQSNMTPQSTILHITHISTQSYTRYELSKALVETLKTFPSARTLTVTEDPFLDSSPLQDGEEEKDDAPVHNELKKLCLLRAIRIIGKIGSDVCCLSKAYNSLTAPRMY